MPLVIFNYQQSEDNPTIVHLDQYKKTIILPDHALDKRWRLHAVNAVYHDNAKENFQTFEMKIPQLMNSEKMLYSTKGIGGVGPPEESFRFYVNHHQFSHVEGNIRWPTVHGYVSEYPNYDLGFHDRSSNEISLIVTPRRGNGKQVLSRLNSYNIILEYEE